MFTQLPPVQGSTLATEYIDICLASCLMTLAQCAVTLRLDRGATHQTQPDHFSLVEEVRATLVNYQESFCKYLSPLHLLNRAKDSTEVSDASAST